MKGVAIVWNWHCSHLHAAHEQASMPVAAVPEPEQRLTSVRRQPSDCESRASCCAASRAALSFWRCCSERWP